MGKITFAALLLLSILVHKTHNATLLEASIAKIKEIKPEKLMDMASQPFSEVNFQALAKAVGTVFSSLQMLGLNDANNRLLALEQSTSILSTGQNTLSSKIAQLDKDLNSRIDVLQAVINPVLETHKTKIAALEASGTSLRLQVAKLDVDLRGTLATTTARVTSLGQTVTSFSGNFLTIKSGLEAALRASSSQITALSKAIEKKLIDEANLRVQSSSKSSADIEQLQKDLKKVDDKVAALKTEEDGDILALEGKLALLTGNADISGLDGRLQEVEKNTKNLLATVNENLVPGQGSQDKKIQNLESEVYDVIKGEVNRLSGIVDSTDIIVKRIAPIVESKTEGVVIHETRIKSLEDSVKKINLEIDTPNSENDIQGKLKKLSDDLTTLAGKVDDPKSQTDLNDRLTELTTRFNTLSDIVDKADNEADLVGDVKNLQKDLSNLIIKVDNSDPLINHEIRITALETVVSNPTDHVFTSAKSGTFHKVASLSFTGTPSTTSTLNDDFEMISANANNNVHTYTINILNSLFTTAPIISVSLSSTSTASSVSDLVVNTKAITATSFEIVVTDTSNGNSPFPDYIVEAILYGN